MIKRYLNFFLRCFKKGNYSNSPNSLNKALKVLNTINKTKKNIKFEEIRYNLLKDNRILKIKDLGAGSKIKNNSIKKISYIARNSLTKTKYCIFFKEIIEENNLKNILEFGTSFGITTMYMKSAYSNPKILTVEGDKQIAEIAKNNFSSQNLKIDLVNKSFKDFLETESTNNVFFDLIFLDGNHKKDATLEYFNILEKKLNFNGLIVFDDIRWSNGMFEAWTEIVENTEKGFFLDLFKKGIYFKDKSIKKQYYCKFSL